MFVEKEILSKEAHQSIDRLNKIEDSSFSHANLK